MTAYQNVSIAERFPAITSVLDIVWDYIMMSVGVFFTIFAIGLMSYGFYLGCRKLFELSLRK